MAKSIKDELAIERTRTTNYCQHPAPTVGVERVCLVDCKAIGVVLTRGMSSFKKREKALRRTHRERAQVGCVNLDSVYVIFLFMIFH